MTQYYGDFSEDSTVYIPFNTFTSDDPSTSATITNLADADIKVHKDGSATEIVTDGASVSIDFDTITGNHLITIDTSVSADYSTGSDYLVRIEGTTVDAATINAWIGSFSIQNRYMRGTDSAATATALATVDSNVDAILVDTGTTIPAAIAVVDGIVDDILVDTGTTLPASITTIDSNVDAILVDTGTTLPASLATIDSNVDSILADTSASVIASGTAQSATGTTLVLASATSFADDLVIGATVVITGGSAGVGQSRTIVDWVNTTDTATVDAWTVTPTGTITYTVFATPPASSTNVPPVNVTQWLGTAAATPTTAGVPEVDITYINGTAVIGDGSTTPWGP